MDEPRATEDPGKAAGLTSAQVLSLLEPDQLVSAKRHHFGRRTAVPWQTVAFWILRVYWVAVLVVAVLAAMRAIKG
jgi:hypothetical protein